MHMHNTIFTCRALVSTTLINMETFFMNTKNSKTSEPNRFKYDLIDKLGLKNPNKNMALGNLSIYYTWKNVKSTYNNNKFKISAPTWNETLIYLMDCVIYQKYKIILNI